jgi:hypothetical protein
MIRLRRTVSLRRITRILPDAKRGMLRTACIASALPVRRPFRKRIRVLLLTARAHRNEHRSASRIFLRMDERIEKNERRQKGANFP